MNWKLILVGGVVYYAAHWLIAPISMPLIHDGVLADDYEATVMFWRPELITDNLGALMPRWIVTGLIGAFIVACVYGWIRTAFAGAGWLRGLKFGVLLALLSTPMMMGYSSVFNLPDHMWAWWALESTATYLVAGAALGWVADKIAPQSTAPAARPGESLTSAPERH